MWVLSTAVLGLEPPWVIVVLHSLSPGFPGNVAAVLADSIQNSVGLPPVSKELFYLAGAKRPLPTLEDGVVRWNLTVPTNAVLIVFVEGFRVIQADHRLFAQDVSIFAPCIGGLRKILKLVRSNGFTAVGGCWEANCLAQELL
jgi:hypothetical protein